MQNFDNIKMTSFDEASAYLRGHAAATALSGGTDLLGVIKDDILPVPEALIDLKPIPGYDKIEETEEAITLGAGAKLSKVAELAAFPALAQAARSVASPLIRVRATVGGNICQDTRCWYYRYPDSIGGAFDCRRKGGDTCYAIQGENRYHSVFGGMSCFESACSHSCPGGTEISEYLEHLRDGDWDQAASAILRKNPMPMLTSRICPHPCQDACNQNIYGDPVNIHAVERALGDYILANAARFYAAPAAESGKKICIIGAGPGGLAAAFYLRQAGHAVTVYDKNEKAGGVLRYGIPHYRLPREILDRFVDALGGMGVVFELGAAVEGEQEVEALRSANDRLFIATGAWKQPVLGLDGENLTQFGLDFLTEVNTYLTKAIGKNVLVCGGGNVAMDVALTAVRLGAEKVSLVCLETLHEMPASAEEVERAIEEGVEIHDGWGLGRVLTGGADGGAAGGGVVSGLEAKKCISVFDSEGRFAPVYDEDTRMELTSDYIILATGQRVSLDFLGEKLLSQISSPRGLLAVDEANKTAVEGVYAGGDAATGPDIAIRAIGAGRVAATAINRDFGCGVAGDAGGSASGAVATGGDGAASAAAVATGGSGVKRKRFDRVGVYSHQAIKPGELAAAERTLTAEDTLSISQAEAIQEAGRCMNCGCYAVNPSDIAPVLVMAGAVIVTTERLLPAREFFAGLRVKDTLRPGEIVKEIRVPKPNGVTAYDKSRVRDAIDFATVSLASQVVMDGGAIRSVKLVYGGVAASPVEAEAAEAFLTGKAIDDAVLEEAAALAIADASPMDKNETKLFIMSSLLKEAVERAKGAAK